MPPHEYVERLSGNKHIMLLHDEPKYAREIEAIFIAQGLQKGECCIYVSHDDHAFEQSLLEPLGLDGKKYLKDGSLHLVRMGEFAGKANNKLSLQKLLCDQGSKARLVGRWVPDISTVKGMASELELEREIHSVFHDFPGSILCTYQIDSICKTDHADWTMKIMNAHHSVIMLTGERDGTVHEF